jgi:hypothetical protein
MYVKGISWEYVDRISLPHDGDQWQAAIKAVTELRVLKMRENLWIC